MIIIALKKMCRCGRLIDYGKIRCDVCEALYQQEKRESYKDYKAKRMEDEEERKLQQFYNSKQWIRTRDYIKTKYKGLCLYSYYVLNQIVYTDYIHHVIEIREDWDKRLEERNLIPVCASVHQTIHKQYSKSNKDKKALQEILFNLLDKWNKEFGSEVR